jgi:hypothetical protein
MPAACLNCGSPLKADDAFCGVCGTAVPLPVPVAAVDRTPVELPGTLPDSWETGLAVSYSNASDEPSFDPLHNRRFGWQLVRRFLLWQSVPWFIGFLVGIVAVPAGKVGALLLIPLVWIVCVALFVFLPVPGLLAQWSRLVPFGAGAQRVAFEHIRQAMAAHATPNDTIDIQSKPIPGEGIQHYLRLKNCTRPCATTRPGRPSPRCTPAPWRASSPRSGPSPPASLPPEVRRQAGWRAATSADVIRTS